MCSNKCAWCLGCPSTRSLFAANGLAGDLVGRRGVFLKAYHGNPLSLFGSSRCFPALMAAIAAVTLKRPARFVLTREVDTSTTGHRCLVEIDNVTQFDPGTRQAQTTNSVSTALGNSSQLDLIWQSMLGAPATSQSPGLTP